VREESIFGYIFFGTALRFLQDAKPGWSINKDGMMTYNLNRFINDLEKLGLLVTATAARHQNLPAMLSEFKDLPADAQLSDDQAKKLTDAMRAVRQTLEAEATQKKAFVAEPKRWEVDRLLEKPGAMFGKGVFDRLNSQAALDFSEACKCIAFERSTAAAFHTMRGTEAVLRAFYCHVVRQKRLPKERQMWGPMIDQLSKRSKPPPAALLDNLDAIRRNFRNPTQHPDETYTLDSAQDLFGMIIPAVNQMVTLMK
jgi:hypothetical protein